MRSGSKISKQQLLKTINDLEKSPSDRVRILGDVGITTAGLGLGAAAAGSVASIAGITSIPFVTSAASAIGITAVAATPVGWIAGAAVAGGALAFGVSRLIHNGGLSEGRKRELLQFYQEQSREMQRREQRQESSDADRIRLITSLREVIEKNAIAPQKAFQLIEAVERGAIPLSQAFSLVAGILESAQQNK